MSEQPKESGQLATKRHRWRSVVVNQVHIWECQNCGERNPPWHYHELPMEGCRG